MKTVRTAARVLRHFTATTPEFGVTELARAMALDKTTVFRLLRSLCEARLVEQDPTTKRYRLGLGVLDLAAVRLAQFGVIEVAREPMARLRDETGETVALIVRDGHEVVCLHAVEPATAMRVSFSVGERSPLHVTASGLLWLSEMGEEERARLLARSLASKPTRPLTSPAAYVAMLERVRREGCAIADRVAVDDVSVASAPIRDRTGAIAHCLIVAAPSQRVDLDGLWKRAHQVKTVATRIALAMGGRREAPGLMRSA